MGIGWCGDFSEEAWAVGIPLSTFLILLAVLAGAAWYWHERVKRQKAGAAAALAQCKKEKDDADAKWKKEKEELEAKCNKEKDDLKAQHNKEKGELEDRLKKEKDGALDKLDDRRRNELEAMKRDTKRDVLAALDGKLRELQDGHRATMLSDTHNRIMWIAEGVRQARDAVERT